MRNTVYKNNTRNGKSFCDYDYSVRTSREETVRSLLDNAARCKMPINAYWKKMRAYYDGDHEISAHNSAFAGEPGGGYHRGCQRDGESAASV